MVVEPEVAVDDKWAVPRDLLACPLLLIALNESSSNSESNIRKACEADNCEGRVDGPGGMADSVRA